MQMVHPGYAAVYQPKPATFAGCLYLISSGHTVSCETIDENAEPIRAIDHNDGSFEISYVLGTDPNNSLLRINP